MSAVPPPPGKLFDVGGYRMHLQIQGQGGLAAIMDSGLLGNSVVWINTLEQVAQITQACAFDRPGYAWSDPAPAGVPRTSQQLVIELRSALRHAAIQPPYILLGHSWGAINMLVFAYTHPEEVAGLVLVDPSHPEMFERIPEIPKPKAAERPYRVMTALARAGLFRPFGRLLAGLLVPDGGKVLPPAAWSVLSVFVTRPNTFETARRELESGEQSFAEARRGPGSLGDLPLEILTAEWWVTGKQTALKQKSVELRQEMVKLSSLGRLVTVSGCDHTTLPIVRADAVAESVKRILALQPAGAP